MSDARAIEAVTETLRSLIDMGVKEVEAGGVGVARPPDQVRDTDGMQVNLFLYQTAVEGGMRDQDPPAVLPGETGYPALPLVLHYLVTPYATQGNSSEIDAHRLLGGAIRILHDHAVLTRRELAELAPYSDLSRQVERIRITWLPMGDKDINSLWTAFQTPYRLSAAFEVRVVLIDSHRMARTPLPVLRRGPQDRGPVARADTTLPFPLLTAAAGPYDLPVGRLGEDVELRGANLAGDTVAVRLTRPLLDEPVTLTPGEAGADRVRFTVPDLPGELPAGPWSVAVAITDPDQTERVTNEVPLAIAPRITSDMPVEVVRNGAGTAVVPLTCAPSVRPEQRVFLLLGDRAVRAEPVTDTTDALEFWVQRAEPGEHLTRLRVDGVDSVLVDRSVTPPSFDATQTVVVT